MIKKTSKKEPKVIWSSKGLKEKDIITKGYYIYEIDGKYTISENKLKKNKLIAIANTEYYTIIIDGEQLHIFLLEEPDNLRNGLHYLSEDTQQYYSIFLDEDIREMLQKIFSIAKKYGNLDILFSEYSPLSFLYVSDHKIGLIASFEEKGDVTYVY